MARRWMAVLLVAAALASAGEARAHSEKRGTVPADGATVEGSPPAIEMTFDKPMRVTHVRLEDAAGVERVLERTDDMQALTTFQAKPEALPPGRYTVEWRGLAADGHAMEGRFSFEVR